MTSLRRFLCLCATLPVLALAACGGEGWEMVPYHGVPYGDERTAGTGVAFVRANMMPAKGTVIEEPEEEVVVEEEEAVEEPAVIEPEPEPVVEEQPPAPEPEPEAPITEADKVFDSKQRK